ncbi:MAG TPA: hypothetical protein VJ717_10865 [Gemmatimonadaceae bacterium]|nr:hypothetical protein [Gemmatimonadaceae bacterium]
MILEHEVIEQIEDEANGRAIEWVRNLLSDLGAGEPFLIIREMWRAGYLTVVDETGREVPRWQCEEMWRGQREPHDAYLVATALGVKWVHGR